METKIWALILGGIIVSSLRATALVAQPPTAGESSPDSLSGRPAKYAGGYTLVDTGQTKCYDNRAEIPAPKPGEPFFGQDAQYRFHPPAYKDNGDGTITDLNTGLTWIQKPPSDRYSWAEAMAYPASLNAKNYAGQSEWRLPTVKELFSLIDYGRGWPRIDTKYFVCTLAAIHARRHENLFSVGTHRGDADLADEPRWHPTGTGDNRAELQRLVSASLAG